MSLSNASKDRRLTRDDFIHGIGPNDFRLLREPTSLQLEEWLKETFGPEWGEDPIIREARMTYGYAFLRAEEAKLVESVWRDLREENKRGDPTDDDGWQKTSAEQFTALRHGVLWKNTLFPTHYHGLVEELHEASVHIMNILQTYAAHEMVRLNRKVARDIKTRKDRLAKREARIEERTERLLAEP